MYFLYASQPVSSSTRVLWARLFYCIVFEQGLIVFYVHFFSKDLLHLKACLECVLVRIKLRVCTSMAAPFCTFFNLWYAQTWECLQNRLPSYQRLTYCDLLLTALGPSVW